MPKRNNKFNNRPWKHGGREGEETNRYYYEHDDRGPDSTRKVSFLSKNRISKHIGRKRDGRDGEVPIHALLGDEDVEMVGAALAKGGRFKGYKGGGGGPGPSRGHDRGGPRPHPGGGRHMPIGGGTSGPVLLPDMARYHKVLILHGSKYEKSYIISVILSYISPITFTPFLYRNGPRDSTFFVDDQKVASTLQRASQKITVNDGFRLGIRVYPTCPNSPVDERFKQKVLAALQGRYNESTNALDLRCLRTDPNLVQDMILLLFRTHVQAAVVDLIVQHMPSIVGLNLSDNQLSSVEGFQPLVRRVPSLKVLHLGNNKLRDVRKLDCLKGMMLEELFLDGNPLCDKFNKEEVYVSEVRKRFPRVVRLDGAQLAAPINFDIAEDTKLPVPIASFMVNSEAEAVARQFLQQYFVIYDSDNRRPICDAYHDNASFSLSVMISRNDPNHRLMNYIQESRNLLRVQDPFKRFKLLSVGKAAVVNRLCQLPDTKHDLASFTVDLPVFSGQLVFLTVSGLFSEPKVTNVPVRHFSRTFLIIPQGTGFVIVNDLLVITNATEKQLKPAFTKTETVPTPVVTPVATPVGTPVVSPVTSPVVPDDMKEQMVVAMCQQTSMNVLWARKCLEENNWDYNVSMQVFAQLHRGNKVPPEAFTQ